MSTITEAPQVGTVVLLHSLAIDNMVLSAPETLAANVQVPVIMVGRVHSTTSPFLLNVRITDAPPGLEALKNNIVLSVLFMGHRTLNRRTNFACWLPDASPADGVLAFETILSTGVIANE